MGAAPIDPAGLVARIQAQRESWVELAPGKRVRIRRPAEAQLARFRNGITVDHLAECVVGWEGFTEADLLGPAVGASDALPFAPELWGEVVRDRMDWVGTLAEALAEVISAHLAQRAATAKN